MKRFALPLFFVLVALVSLFLYELQSCKHEPIPLGKIDTICFQSQVLPILTLSCAISGCHDTTSHKSGFIATSYSDLLKYITPGNPSGSRLYNILNGPYNSKLMPPENPLPANQRTLISIWISQGAQYSQCSATLPADGASLYTLECSSCHNPLATSTKGGATFIQIQNAITTVSSMSSLSTLTTAQIQAIANVLAAIKPPPLPTDGPSLYALKCASCHNPLASSTIGGATVAQIQNSINTVPGMSSLSTLTTAQIQAIANALATITPPPLPTDGPSLYALKCANCHNPLATSTKGGATAAIIQNGILTVKSMNFLSNLTTAQIQAIAEALSTITPPPLPVDGPSLYALECANCHNPLATSTKGGATVAQIQNGINTVPGMSSLSTLTTAQIQAIANTLATITPPPLPADGPSLYALECANCHNPLATSTKGGATATQIHNGISTVTSMNFLSTLTNDQVQAIADALSTITPPPLPADGPSLYAMECASCHNPLASSTKGGATVAQIQNGISTVPGMFSLTTLSADQIQAISNALATISPPPLPADGSSLYAIECANCHNPLATSTKGGATASQIQNAINTVTSMNFLSILTIAQTQAIADALAAITPPPLPADGPSLYALKCAGCHNPLATSTKGGATVAQIQNGINTVSGMSSLSVLTTDQIQAIANALATISPPPLPTDGSSLYALECANCHNPLATSTKGGATASQIQNAISSVTNMNSLSTLTTTQIQAIADVLATISPPPLPTDGPSLYTLKCEGCHGALATSTKIGASVSRIQNAITTVSNMNSLSTLTTEQIQAISDALTSIPMPTDGPSLYSINCSSCHRVLASSNIGGASVSDIQEAIREVNKMKYLSFLTLIQIQTISKTLSTIKGDN